MQAVKTKTHCPDCSGTMEASTEEDQGLTFRRLTCTKCLLIRRTLIAMNGQTGKLKEGRKVAVWLSQFLGEVGYDRSRQVKGFGK